MNFLFTVALILTSSDFSAGDTPFFQFWMPRSIDLMGNPIHALSLLNESSNSWEISPIYNKWSTTETNAGIFFSVPLDKQMNNYSSENCVDCYSYALAALLIRANPYDRMMFNNPKLRIEVPGHLQQIKPIKQHGYWMDDTTIWKLYLIKAPNGTRVIRIRGVGAATNYRPSIYDQLRLTQPRQRRRNMQSFIEVFGLTPIQADHLSSASYQYENYEAGPVWRTYATLGAGTTTVWRQVTTVAMETTTTPSLVSKAVAIQTIQTPSLTSRIVVMETTIASSLASKAVAMETIQTSTLMSNSVAMETTTTSSLTSSFTTAITTDVTSGYNESKSDYDMTNMSPTTFSEVTTPVKTAELLAKSLNEETNFTVIASGSGVADEIFKTQNPIEGDYQENSPKSEMFLIVNNTVPPWREKVVPRSSAERFSSDISSISKISLSNLHIKRLSAKIASRGAVFEVANSTAAKQSNTGQGQVYLDAEKNVQSNRSDFVFILRVLAVSILAAALTFLASTVVVIYYYIGCPRLNKLADSLAILAWSQTFSKDHSARRPISEVFYLTETGDSDSQEDRKSFLRRNFSSIAAILSFTLAGLILLILGITASFEISRSNWPSNGKVSMVTATIFIKVAGLVSFLSVFVKMNFCNRRQN